MTSVWKKFSMLLLKGSALAAILLALSLNACSQQKHFIIWQTPNIPELTQA